MTVNDAVKRVKRASHRGDQAVTTDQITTDILACINDARREVVRKLPQDYLRKTSTFNTVQGTSTYSLASDTQFAYFLHYTNTSETLMQFIDSEREFYLNVWSATAVQAAPIYWTFLGRDGSSNRQIKIFPVPDAVYTITSTYYKDPTSTDLTTSDLSSQIPDIPSYVQDAVWKGALYYFLKGFDDPGTKEAKMDYDQAMQEIDSDDTETDVKKKEGFGESTINDDNRRIP